MSLFWACSRERRSDNPWIAATLLRRAEEFEVLSRLVTIVPVRKINRAREGSGIVEFCAMIKRNFLANIGSPSNRIEH
jgi:hypothetical protein